MLDMDVIYSMNINYMNSGVKTLCTVTKLETSNIFHQLNKTIIMKQFFAYLHVKKYFMPLRAATLKLMLWFRVL